MLRALAFIAMGQKQDQARHAQPFPLAAGQELVDHNLRTVREITELCLPDHKRIRLGETVAIFEPQHRLLGEHRIDDLKAGLLVRDVVQRGILLLVQLIGEHRMALREGSAFHVLAGKPDGEIFLEKRPECERFGHSPVDAAPFADHLAPVGEQPVDRLVQCKALGDFGELCADLLQRVDADAGMATARSFLGER